MTKVALLGLDGCTWRLLTPFLQTGLAPNLKLIVENGTSGELLSTIPPATSPAWPSMVTGLNPGKLGVYSTNMRSNEEDYSLKPVTSSVYKGKAIWDYLSDGGSSVALFKIPFLYPVYKIRGCMVSGFGSASRFSTYPSSLYKKLVAGPSRIREENLFKRYKTMNLKDTRECLDFIQQLKKLVKEENQVILELLDTLDWDFLFYVVSATDWLQHPFMDKLLRLTQKLEYSTYKDLSIMDKALVDFYREINSLIGCILKSLEKLNDNYILLLASDHGFTIRPQTFNLAKWLIANRYMRLKPRHGQQSFRKRILNLKIIDFAENIASQPFAERILRILPKSVLSWLAKTYYKTRASSIGSISRLVDPNNSQAFCLEDRAIYLNSSGDHSVDLDKLTKDLESDLERFDGPKLRTFRKNEVYWGDKTKLAPDLIIEITDGDNIWELSTDPYAPQIFKPSLPGRHDHYGIFAAYGSGIRGGFQIQDVKIMDLAPTILHIFGLPIPKDMDGKVLNTIFEPGSELAKRKITYRDAKMEEEKEEPSYTYSKEEEEKIKERMRALGYL